MVKVPSKESLSAIIARLDERVNNFLHTNSEEHKTILESIRELCVHVNEENKGITKRLDMLEKIDVVLESKYKGRMELFKWLSIGLGLMLTTIGILHTIGVF